MMKSTPVSSGAAASGYYKAEGYYKSGTEEAEGVATWFGKEAARLELSGPVDDQVFAKVLDGQTFEKGNDGLVEGRVMGRYVNGERQHLPGVDLTFSAPKDVSIAALVFGDDRVVKAHDAAVQKALSFIESDVAETRRMVNGKVVVEQGGGLIGGAFRHDTSRALDPQLHTHAVVANMVRNSAGEITALHNKSLFDSQRLGSEIYRDELGKSLTELGYTVERVGRHQLMELKEVPQSLSDQFSKRREQIEAALEQRGMLDTPVNANIAALLTRVHKSGDIDRAELKQSWLDEAKSKGIDGPAIEAIFDRVREKSINRLPGVTRDGIPTNDATLALNSAIGHLSERSVSFSKIDLLTAAQRFSHTADIQSLSAALNSAKGDGTLLLGPKGPENRENYTTSDLLVVEKNITREVRSATKSFALPSNVHQEGRTRSWESHLNRAMSRNTSLTDGQSAGLAASLTGSDRYVVIQGSAGTGKTYMLGELVKQASVAGLTVEGLGPSIRATQELSEVIQNPETLQARLLRGRSANREIDNSKTILVVDEASMISNADMTSLLKQAREQNIGRVVLLGDVKQLDSVSAGTPFDLLQKTGVKTAIMNDVVRQRDGQLKGAVLNAISGEVHEAFNKLGSNVFADQDYAKLAADLYVTRRSSGQTNDAVVTPSNDVREAINSRVREGLKSMGQIADQDTTLPGLKALHLSSVEASDARSYVEGDTIVAHRSSTHLGLIKNHQYAVQSVDKTSLTIIDTASGQPITMPLSASSVGATPFSAFEPVERDFAKGDDVRFRVTDKKSEIANGDTGTIYNVTKDTVEILKSDGEVINLSTSSLAAKTLDHAYALTGHDMQGATIDNVIVAMGSREYLADQKSFYVGISRARDNATLVTDDPQRLADRLASETGEKLSAIETYLAAFEEKQINKIEKSERDDPEKSAQDEPQKKHDTHKTDRETNPKDKEEDQLNFLEEMSKVRDLLDQKTHEDRTR